MQPSPYQQRPQILMVLAADPVYMRCSFLKQAILSNVVHVPSTTLPTKSFQVVLCRCTPSHLGHLPYAVHLSRHDGLQLTHGGWQLPPTTSGGTLIMCALDTQSSDRNGRSADERCGRVSRHACSLRFQSDDGTAPGRHAHMYIPGCMSGRHAPSRFRGAGASMQVCAAPPTAASVGKLSKSAYSMRRI